MNRYNVRFEATGFTNDHVIASKVCSEMEADGFTDTMRAENELPAGVVRVVGGYITEDDNQGDSDIHVFISVTLIIKAESEAAAESRPIPIYLLNDIADIMGSSISEQGRLDVERDSLEIMDVDEVAETSPHHFVSVNP